MARLPATESLIVEDDAEWLTIWFNRPGARNALSSEVVTELAATLDAVRDDRSIRGITLRGKGGVFCAGGDVKGFKAVFQGEDQSREDVAASNRAGGELFDRLYTMPQVVVMLVEGAAIAGGLGMACAGDIVVVTRDARFAITETTLGIPPAQIAPYLVARLGLPAARRLALTAARFTGAEAKDLGLADRVVDDAAGFAAVEAELRAAVRRSAPGAIAETKKLLLAASIVDREAMLDMAADSFARCMLSNEGREGVAAFIEKRKPKWAE